eukprot:CAMPEP_0116147886 /NCGR_PEP_ID=MMETSP0329-20121206/18021_1 /TAXON_ID=697910 /ORGANISM="Pseudo-nitzschia arenysensis, Strain B593" /LENGTH=706 /DNA_ID=CAMNT_0003643899 /DNA_START=98 /DNA_END=2218 /DNA_ORIENTATION=+
MLARWFDRSGIGQLLAPDPDAAPVSENDECRSDVWQYLAPDDNFSDPKAPPSEIFPPQIQPSPNSFPETPKNSSANNNNNNNIMEEEEDDMNARVLSACRDTNKFMRSPMPERKRHDKFLRLCASTKPLNKKLVAKMRTMVSDESFRDAYLLRVRATRMGESAPDGLTSLMAAAYANHVQAAQLILDLAKEYASVTNDTTTYSDLHLDRDIYGSTALHIAADRGHLEMVQLLMPLYDFPMPDDSKNNNNNNNKSKLSSLVDMGGHTAFGRAVTSPVPKAKKNQRSLEKQLFVRNDLSIFGAAKPLEERMGSMASLGLEYGTADMPGMRGYMEDALSVGTFSFNDQEMALFAVCDGHGDNGKISDFLSTNAKSVLEECMNEYQETTKTVMVPTLEYWTKIWESVCLKLDQKLKEVRLTEGGSTAVMALVTKQEIVVANVGDSRCCLACSSSSNSSNNNKEQTKEEPKDEKIQDDAETKDAAEGDQPTAESSEETPALVEEVSSSSENDNNNSDMKESTVIVTALSEDHKPNLPDEMARVQKAGLEVESISVKEEDGTETLIYKVKKSDKDQLAVSRAFGDFDYKANTTLSEVEQAIIPLAEVKIHTRNDDDLYLVLACDGIWDVMNNEQAIEVVQQQVEIKTKYSPDSLLPDVADGLLQECLEKESRDNLSAIVVSLNSSKATTTAASNETNETFQPKALDFGSLAN